MTVTTLVDVASDVAVEPLPPAPAPESTEPEPRPLVPVWVWLGAILFVAAFVRTWGLNHVGFNSDETVYAGQAASIAGNVTLQKFFPIYRAHPLLFQSLLSVLYQITTSDYAARLLSVSFGVGTVFLTYLSAKLLYGRRAGLIAAALLAVMPYHVVVTRQVLLDGPLVFFSTLTLYLVARYAITQKPIWLYATGAGMGLTFLAKETGIVLVAAVYAFIALAPRVKVRIRDLFISGAVMVLVMLPYPLSVAFGNSSKTGKSFFAWQLLRRPYHGIFFYFTTVPAALGYILLAAAIAGLWVLRKERSWREILMLAWILVPIGFFQFWPVKGFQYLLPIATPVAILAARSLARMPVRNWRRDTSTGLSPIVSGIALGAIGLSLLLPTIQRISPSSSGTFLAGSGGVAGGREAGRWVGANVPRNAQLLALGPSMANIIQFYGDRKTYGLSVSTNPLHRNPVYEPLANADLKIRRGDLQYLVWDSYSANRSPLFAGKLLRFAEKYHGRVVHAESVKVSSGGVDGKRRVVVIYEVRP
jgi:4-amino-4-deoxy-L-arabinose transferase-like glycosyltransferase